jgi:hypothetical protein
LILLQKRLSGETQANSLLRREGKKETCFPDQQRYLVRPDDYGDLSQTLAERAILQMDQAASADKSILWNVRKCGQDANMDCHHHYVLVAIIKKQLKLEQSLYTILQIVSVTLFEKMPLLQALTDVETIEQEVLINNQLNLFS